MIIILIIFIYKVRKNNILIDNLVISCYLYNRDIDNYSDFMRRSINKYIEILKMRCD